MSSTFIVRTRITQEFKTRGEYDIIVARIPRVSGTSSPTDPSEIGTTQQK